LRWWPPPRLATHLGGPAPSPPVADKVRFVNQPAETDAQQRDSLPADLDPTALVGPYIFPDNNRRRIPGIIYLVLAAITVSGVILAKESPLVNNGLLLGSAALALVGLYHLQGAWTLKVDDADALVAANRAVGFPVGHASAQMAWRGLRSRPTWRILLYSNESPPEKRGLVFIDGVDGEIVAQYVEENPEEWANESAGTRVHRPLD